MMGLAATLARLVSSRCDYCFMVADKIHRCRKCLTKTYSSEECLLKDREEKHHEFCQEGAEERKVKRDSKGRVEAGLKELEVGFEESLKMIDNDPSDKEVHAKVKEELVAVK